MKLSPKLWQRTIKSQRAHNNGYEGVAMQDQDIDPTGLIRESYRIDGITAEECRSIFVDWALKLSHVHDPVSAMSQLMERYGNDAPDHPMTSVLREGLTTSAQPKRRGGRSARQA